MSTEEVIDTRPEHVKNAQRAAEHIERFLAMLSWDECFMDECETRIKELEEEIKQLKFMKADRDKIATTTRGEISRIISRAKKGDYCNVLDARNAARPPGSKIPVLSNSKK